MNNINSSTPTTAQALTQLLAQQTPATSESPGSWRHTRNTVATGSTTENGTHPLPTRVHRPGPSPASGGQPFLSCPAGYCGRPFWHGPHGHNHPGIPARTWRYAAESRSPGFRSEPRRTSHTPVQGAKWPHCCPAENCTRRFMQLFHMRAHRKVHSEVQPYPCQQADCNKQFRTAGSLRRHMKTHTKKPHGASPPAVGGPRGVKAERAPLTDWTAHWHHGQRAAPARPVPTGAGEVSQPEKTAHQPQGTAPGLWRGWVDRTVAGNPAEQGVPLSSIRESGVVESVATEPDASPPAESLADAQWLLDAGFTLAGYCWPQQETPCTPPERSTTPLAASVSSVCVKPESPQHSAPGSDP